MEQKTFKRCPRCGETKLREGFNKNRTTQDGCQHQCRECKARFDRAWKQAHPRSNWAHVALKDARARAKDSDLPFSLTLLDLRTRAEAATVCPVIGIEFSWPKFRESGKKAARGSSATLDKVDPRLGYVPGNVRIISMQANNAKRDKTPEEILAKSYPPHDAMGLAIQRYVRQHYAEDA